MNPLLIIISQSLYYALPETNQPKKHKNGHYFTILLQSNLLKGNAFFSHTIAVLTCSLPKNSILTSDCNIGSLSTGHLLEPFSLQKVKIKG
jgi:hypothetical protein